MAHSASPVSFRHSPRPPSGLLELEPAQAKRAISPVIVTGSVRIVEFTIAVLSGLLTAALYLGPPTEAAALYYLGAVAIAAGTMTMAFELSGLYTARAVATAFASLPRIALGWTIAFAVLGTAIFFFKAGQELSRIWLASWFIAGAILLTAERIALATAVKKWAESGRLYRRAVIYGVGEITSELISELERDAGTDIRIVGIFDDRGEARTHGQPYQRLGTLDDCVKVSRAMGVDLVMIALPVAAEKRLSKVASRLSVLPADIKLPALATEIRFSRRLYSHIGSVAMIDLYDKPITDWGYVAKSTFDKILSAAALVALSPVMLLVALAIKLESKGPVLFRQKRYGFNNELIEVYKFRSMYTDLCDASASKLVSRDDPRVTRVGRFIRRTSLDELPQLFNVLKGELSLVGPRPHAVSAKAANQLYNEVVADYFARHKVKPGITGWAQINGWRGETDTREKLERRIEHDLYYIDNWSVLFDLVILARTPFALLKSEGAY